MSFEFESDDEVIPGTPERAQILVFATPKRKSPDATVSTPPLPSPFQLSPLAFNRPPFSPTTPNVTTPPSELRKTWLNGKQRQTQHTLRNILVVETTTPVKQKRLRPDAHAAWKEEKSPSELKKNRFDRVMDLQAREDKRKIDHSYEGICQLLLKVLRDGPSAVLGGQVFAGTYKANLINELSTLVKRFDALPKEKKSNKLMGAIVEFIQNNINTEEDVCKQNAEAFYITLRFPPDEAAFLVNLKTFLTTKYTLNFDEKFYFHSLGSLIRGTTRIAQSCIQSRHTLPIHFYDYFSGVLTQKNIALNSFIKKLNGINANLNQRCTERTRRITVLNIFIGRAGLEKYCLTVEANPRERSQALELLLSKINEAKQKNKDQPRVLDKLESLFQAGCTFSNEERDAQSRFLNELEACFSAFENDLTEIMKLFHTQFHALLHNGEDSKVVAVPASPPRQRYIAPVSPGTQQRAQATLDEFEGLVATLQRDFAMAGDNEHEEKQENLNLLANAAASRFMLLKPPSLFDRFTQIREQLIEGILAFRDKHETNIVVVREFIATQINSLKQLSAEADAALSTAIDDYINLIEPLVEKAKELNDQEQLNVFCQYICKEHSIERTTAAKKVRVITF